MINESIGKVYQAGIATKILQYMNKIRNESDITQARRWVMELLQNARDLAWEGKPLKVQIELTENALYFRHSGKPFRVKDILSIVNQVSSKNPGEGVGQFGTGFMTTYQLSEKVEINSILKEDGIPGKRFRVTLDRTGHNKEEILAAISRNLNQLAEADSLPDAAEHAYGESYDTEFCYLLETDRSRDIARTGVTDLADTILYVMLFSVGIGSVEISVDANGGRETVTYRRGDDRRRSENVEELTVIEEHQNGEQIPHTLFFMRDNGLTLAAEYDPERGFLPISERTPRIFVDFPLIGAERFPFPVVINSLFLHPNEPRSGISLVDNADSVEAKENKAIMLSAVEKYKTFVNELVKIDIKGSENLIGIFEWQDNKEWSESWMKNNLYNSVYQTVRELDIIPTASGTRALNHPNLYIIRCEGEDEKEGIRRLIAPLNEYLVPADETDWHSVLEPYQPDENKFIDLKRLLNGAAVFMSDFLKKDTVPALEWNLLLYETAMKNPETATEIRAGNIAVFPSQSPVDQAEYKLYSVNNIYRDPGIPEILKDVAEKVCELDRLSGLSGQIKLRSMLLPREFRLINENIIPEYQLSSLMNYIQSHCNRAYRVSGFNTYKARFEEIWREAWFMMLSCGPDDGMYELSAEWYREELPERKKIEDERFLPSIWGTTYHSVLESMIVKIESLSVLGELKTEQPYKWLNTFYGKCKSYVHNIDMSSRRIYPDQEGLLKQLFLLSRDCIQEEELKEIALCFKDKDPSANMYRELLDRSIELKGWVISEKKDMDAAMRINNVVQKLLMECSLSQAELVYQEACTRLLGWIEEHPKRSEEYFPAFCKEEDQMKLLTPKAAASMHRKAKGYAKLAEMLGSDDPEDLEKIIKVLKEKRAEPNKHEFHEETGMWLDAELMAMPEDERDRICREIGEMGEVHAFDLVCREIMAQGCLLSEESTDTAVYVGDGVEYTVCRPDNSSYHQAGWDIKVVRKRGAEETLWLIEVKTHTPNSVRRGVLQISNEQMRLAAKHSENYIILSVICDHHQKRIRKVNAYRDPCRQLAKGVLRNYDNGYRFIERPLADD